MRAEGPFLSLLREFETALEPAMRLIVVGYSFRDDHVNELIRTWLNTRLERQLVVLDPGWPEEYRLGDFQRQLITRLTRPEIPLPQFQPRLTVIRQPASVGLAEALAQ